MSRRLYDGLWKPSFEHPDSHHTLPAKVGFGSSADTRVGIESTFDIHHSRGVIWSAMDHSNPVSAVSERTALVTGAGGFLAGFIIAALREHGWRVLRGVRSPEAVDEDAHHCDFERLREPRHWAPQLAGVDAVVNVAGILRETGTRRFDTIHHDAPLALAQACVDCGVRRFVQISALGDSTDGAFVTSKHRFDDALLGLPLSAVVLRPSVVYSASGSYGGTSLLRALAAMPGVLLLPGDGEWLIQPLAAEDLAQLVVHALESGECGAFEVGGPHPISLRAYQQRWRAWLRLPVARVVRIPEALASLGVSLSEWLGRGPMAATTWRMLRRGNVTAIDAGERLHRSFGCAPRALDDVLAGRPSQAQDRWHARLYLVAPALRMGIVLLFLISAWVGFATPSAEIQRLAAGSLLSLLHPVELARGAAVIDLVLGIALLIGARVRWVIAAMLALIAAYTLAFGLMLPALWLDPLGGLAKNLVVLPALAALWILSERR